MSATDLDAKYLPFKDVIIKSGQVLTAEIVTFNEAPLHPLKSLMAPLAQHDCSQLNFEDPEFLVSLECYPQFLETARLLLVMNKVIGPETAMDPSKFQWVAMLSPFFAQDLVMAFSPGFLSAWNDAPKFVTVGAIPQDLALAMLTYCTLMDGEIERLLGDLISPDFQLLFFRFHLYLSLGNTAGALRVGIKSFVAMRSWDLEFELVPSLKVVYPMFLLGSFFIEHGELDYGLEALEVIKSFSDRYDVAARATRLLQGKLLNFYPNYTPLSSSSPFSSPASFTSSSSSPQPSTTRKRPLLTEHDDLEQPQPQQQLPRPQDMLDLHNLATEDEFLSVPWSSHPQETDDFLSGPEQTMIDGMGGDNPFWEAQQGQGQDQTQQLDAEAFDFGFPS